MGESIIINLNTMKKDNKSNAISLRQKAEELLKEKQLKTGLQLPEAEMHKLIHELGVHQIELELQNEELMLAKEKAEVASEKYSELYDFAPSGYFTLSKEGEIIELNLCGSQMLGKESSRLKNSMFGFFVSCNSKPTFNLFLEKVFKSKARELCEVALSTNGNSQIYVQLTGIADQNGEQCLVSMVDITGHKRVEEERLEGSEARYRLLFETSADGILIVDVETKTFKYANPALCRMLGYTEKELTTLGLADIHPKQDLQRIITEFESLARGDKSLVPDIPCLRKDGSIVYADINSSNITIGGRPCAVGLFRDITERKRVEADLRDSEQRYRLLIETVNEGIAVAQNGFLKFVNPMMQVITGFTQEELLTLPFIDMVYPEDREIVISNHLKRLKGEQFLPRYQFRIVKKDGSTRRIEMNGIIIEWEGQPATLNMLTDITERKQADEEISFKNELLLKLNTEKDKFFSIIAHDLRGPFSGFLGLTQIMAEDLPSLTMAEIQDIALRMRNSANNLFLLLENLLEWAKMQQGLIPFKPELIQLLPFVDECIVIMQEPAKTKGIEITYDIPDNLKVFADSNILQTVIRNLVSNALKFTPKGGKVSLSAKDTGNKSIEISIRDTGIGMSSKIIDNLFRLDVKTSRKGTEGEPSSGLGLLLCKEFVEKHGGKIWAKSKVEKGTTIYFTIP